MFKTLVPALLFALALGGPATAHDTAFTDGAIAHIAYTAGQIDIAAAEQALKKSKNPEVIAFAELMVRDHSAINEQALALLKTLAVTPEDNATSQALSAGADAKLAELAALEGPAFDAAYVANEAAYHQTVNATLADTLIPAAHNAEFKALLETGLKLFGEHQQHAERLSAMVK